jgi:hypothetical protein
VLIPPEPRYSRTDGCWASGFGVRVSRLLSEHRLGSFVVTTVALLQMGVSIRLVLSKEEGGGVLIWAFLALVAYSAIATVFWVRRGPAESRFLIAWGSGITPALCGMAAALAGSPELVMWVGILLAIGLVGWVAAATRTA